MKKKTHKRSKPSDEIKPGDGVQEEQEQEREEERKEEQEQGTFNFENTEADIKKFGRVVDQKFTKLKDILRHIRVLEMEFKEADFQEFPSIFPRVLRHKFREINYNQKELTSELVSKYDSIVEDMGRYYQRDTRENEKDEEHKALAELMHKWYMDRSDKSHGLL